MQENHSDCSKVALKPSGYVEPDMLCLPNLLTQPFDQIFYRNLANLNLHAWLLELQLSRSRASLRQWQCWRIRPLCLPTSSHLGQSGEVAGLPVQENHSDCSRVTLGPSDHVEPDTIVVLGPSGHVEPDPFFLPNLPNLLTQPFNQILHRNLSSLNLHAWLLAAIKE